MSGQCFKKRDSSQPVCSTHNVPLDVCEVLFSRFAPFLGFVTRYKCPVSQHVVVESEEYQALCLSEARNNPRSAVDPVGTGS